MFTTRTGRRIEPRNLYRSFARVAETAGLREHFVQDTQREAVSHLDRMLKRRPVVNDRTG